MSNNFNQRINRIREHFDLLERSDLRIGVLNERKNISISDEINLLIELSENDDTGNLDPNGNLHCAKDELWKFETALINLIDYLDGAVNEDAIN